MIESYISGIEMRYLKNGQTEEEDWKMDQPGLFIKVSYHLYREVTNYVQEKYVRTDDVDKIEEILEPITYTQKVEVKLPDLVKRSKSDTSSVELSPSTNSPKYNRRKFDHIAQIRKTIKVKDCQWGIIEDVSENFDSSAESEVEEKLPFNFLDDVEVDQENNWEYFNESFCEAFFISGLPFKNAKLIPDSDNFPAPCNHKICSSLPAYRSEVINNFPLKEKNQSTFELTQITSALCFPYGIKLCYNQDESQIKPMKNFMTVTTSIKGQRNYIYIFHYFQKVDYFDFKKSYDFDPIKDQFLKNKIVKLINESSKLNDETNDKKHTIAIERELQDNLLLCSEMINSDYVYLPTAACLVSTHPYSFQMEKSIKAILKTCIDSKLSSYGTFKLLLHLIYEVPIPPDNKRLFFYLPYDSEPIELPGKLFNDLPVIANGVQTLLEYFSTETIIMIHNLMLLEQKLLFIYNDISKLTTITEAFINLLFPFEWTATYIPTLSECLTKYLQSFMPFIMGIELDMLNIAKEYFEEDSGIFLIFVKEKGLSVIETSSMYCNKSPKKSRRSVKHSNIPDFPQVNKAQLLNEVEMIRKLIDKEKKESKKILNFNQSVDSSNKPYDMKHYKFDKYLRMSFIKSNIRLFGDYDRFINCLNEFETERFLSHKPEKYLDFFKEVIETTMFGLLIQNKDNVSFFSKMCKKYSNTIINKDNYNRRRSKIEETKFKTNLLSKIQRAISTTRVDKKKISIKRRGSLFTFDNKVSAPMTTTVSESCKVIPIVKPKEKSKQMTSLKVLPTLDNDNISKTSYSNVSLSDSDLDMNNTIIYHETFMISPYYFDDFIMKCDPDNIEEVIDEKFRYASDLNETLDCRIFSIISQSILPTDVTCRFRRYLLPHTIKRPQSKELALSNNKIEEEIAIYFESILKGSNTKRIEKKDIQRLFRTKLGRKYFGSLIYLDKFNNNDYQPVSEIGFDNLIQMLFTSMLLCLNDPEEFDHIRMMTKSCFCFYKLNGSERYYVYQEVGRSKPFDVWINQDFWENWFVHELQDKKENLKDLIVDEVYIMILIELGITMINLNVDIKIVIYIVVEKIGPKYLKGNTKLLENLEKNLVQQNDMK